MNYGFINHNNKQNKSPMLHFHKQKQKKISDSNRTNAAVFNGVYGKNFLNTFRKSTSKDKSNLKYKTSKNSPNSSLKKIDAIEEYKKLSNEHKDTQPGGPPDIIGKKKKNKNDIYEDLFMRKIKKIYSKNLEHNYGNPKFKKMSANLFNMHSNNSKEYNYNNIKYKRDNKKYLYSNNISNMDYSGKISHHIDSSSEENNMLFNNKNHSSIVNSANGCGILVNSSSILGSNNINVNINEGMINSNNNAINNISSPANINSNNENGFVGNKNLMKHIENKYEKIKNIGNINNNNFLENKKSIIEKNNKSSTFKPNTKVKISSNNYFNNNSNISSNNSSINGKFIYPKFLVKYGDENIGNINNVSNKKSSSILAHGVGIGAYSEFTKLNKTSYPSKTNSSKNSLEKRRSKLLNNNNNNNNNIFINNNSLLQNQEDNNNSINNIIINTNKVKENENNINIMNNNNINGNNIIQDSNIFNKSNSNKDTLNSYIQNLNDNNPNILHQNNLIKSSQLSSAGSSNNNINNFSISNLKGMNPRIERKGENVNVIINNSNKNISIINVNNISYNKQKKIEINNINNNGTCNTNRAKNSNHLLNKINGIQPPVYAEYISTASKNITNSNQEKKLNKKKVHVITKIQEIIMGLKY